MPKVFVEVFGIAVLCVIGFLFCQQLTRHGHEDQAAITDTVVMMDEAGNKLLECINRDHVVTPDEIRIAENHKDDGLHSRIAACLILNATPIILDHIILAMEPKRPVEPPTAPSLPFNWGRRCSASSSASSWCVRASSQSLPSSAASCRETTLRGRSERTERRTTVSTEPEQRVITLSQYLVECDLKSQQDPMLYDEVTGEFIGTDDADPDGRYLACVDEHRWLEPKAQWLFDKLHEEANEFLADSARDYLDYDTKAIQAMQDVLDGWARVFLKLVPVVVRDSATKVTVSWKDLENDDDEEEEEDAAPVVGEDNGTC